MMLYRERALSAIASGRKVRSNVNKWLAKAQVYDYRLCLLPAAGARQARGGSSAGKTECPLDLCRVAPVPGLLSGRRGNHTAMKKIALEVPSRDLRSVGEFHLYAGIVSGMSGSIFRVELVPFILHDSILRFSIAFHELLRP